VEYSTRLTVYASPLFSIIAINIMITVTFISLCYAYAVYCTQIP
jgi:hypothetical protein